MILKRINLLILILLFSLVSGAQKKPSFVALRSGFSFPLGEYHSIDLTDGSFATPGFNVTLEGAWFFIKWLGIGGSAGLNLHPVDVSNLAKEKLMNDSFLTSLIVRSDPYRVITLMAGSFVQYDLKGDFSLTGKLLGGVIQAATPYQLYKADYFMVGQQWYEITSAWDWKPSFLAGAGVKYQIRSCFTVTFDTDFTYNQCEFGFNTYNGVRIDHRKIIFMNTTLGISINL
jgi:hypothetical protein